MWYTVLMYVHASVCECFFHHCCHKATSSTRVQKQAAEFLTLQQQDMSGVIFIIFLFVSYIISNFSYVSAKINKK